MIKQDIIHILEDWNFWYKDLEIGIKREAYLTRLTFLLQSGQVMVITGPRRSGKSFLMRQLASHLITDLGVPKQEILFVNFEDPRFGKSDASLLQAIYDSYVGMLRPAGKPYVFLDEIQDVSDWEKWVRTKHELGEATLIISGSNATLLSRELSTVLTGRHVDVRVSPLSFREFLSFQSMTVTNEEEAMRQLPRLQGYLREYLASGGFPEVVKRTAKKELLLSYFDDVVAKDLVRRYRIRKADKIKELARFYFSHTATLTTHTSVGKFLDISSDTAERFADHLTQAFLLFFVKRFSLAMKEQEKSPRKVYAVDTGLAQAVGFATSDNRGRQLENAVFLELNRRQALDPQLELFYWKDIQHHEVDFVWKKGNRVNYALQVVWEMADPKTKAREQRSLWKAIDTFGLSQGLILTVESSGEELVRGKRIVYVPMWRWLLFGGDGYMAQ